MLLFPWVLLKSASAPLAVFNPLVLFKSASAPVAVFKPSVVLAESALAPMAVLPWPSV